MHCVLLSLSAWRVLYGGFYAPYICKFSFTHSVSQSCVVCYGHVIQGILPVC